MERLDTTNGLLVISQGQPFYLSLSQIQAGGTTPEEVATFVEDWFTTNLPEHTPISVTVDSLTPLKYSVSTEPPPPPPA